MDTELQLQPVGQLAIVPQGTLGLVSAHEGEGFVQPCPNVPKYLEERKAGRAAKCAFHDGNKLEHGLYLTLFADVAKATDDLEKAVRYVQALVNGGLKVKPAIERALHLYHHNTVKYRWKQKTFRATYDQWAKSQDWTDLVNFSKAPASWRDNNLGLADAFLKQVAVYFGRFGRKDGKRQAMFAMERWWRSGKDLDGEARPIPGYEAVWATRDPELRPVGWDQSNIRNQIKARAKFLEADRAFVHEGTAAAKEYLPQIHGTKRNLRFLEEVTFDDVRTDILIFHEGEECELWLLVARDSATRMVLGFVPHPSRAREDGSDSHLGLKEMKQLAGFLLERYPLPPYLCTWKVERGTATLSEGSRIALQEMLPNRIRVTYTSMIGGKSARGYDEKKKGNSRGKASHESHNRLFHTQGSFLPGQTGANYSIRPADLNARVKECKETWAMRETLPKHLRGQEQYTLLTLKQAVDRIFQFCIDQNFRKDHAIEGFEKIQEWYDDDARKWRHQSEFVAGTGRKFRTRTRMEMPVERAIKLMEGYKWERVSTDIIIAFYEHTAWPVTINENGIIICKGVQYCPPTPDGQCGSHRRQSTKALAYFHPDDPHFLHVTTGKGGKSAILGTWIRRERVSSGDQEAITRAMRYTDAALKEVQAYAAELTATERKQLEDIRAHNAELAKANQFIDVADPQLQVAETVVDSPVARALTHAPRDVARQQQADEDFDAEIDAALRKAMQ